MSPALGGVMLPQAHLRYGLARSSTSTPTNKRTHNKKDIDSEVYLLTMETHHESISFLFVLLIITSLSAGVLHVPACKHDKPPLPGFTFYVHARCTVLIILTCCAYRHTRSRPGIGAGNLL